MRFICLTIVKYFLCGVFFFKLGKVFSVPFNVATKSDMLKALLNFKSPVDSRHTSESAPLGGSVFGDTATSSDMSAGVQEPGSISLGTSDLHNKRK